MNRITCRFVSDILRTPVSVNVLLPKNRLFPFSGRQAVLGRFDVLWLLHGASDCGESWLLHSDIAALADAESLAVVLPDGRNSFWLDDAQYGCYFSYLTRELPGYLSEILPLARERERNFIGGISMGGYGALYAALKKPNQYGRVFSLSGTVDIASAAGFVGTIGMDMPAVLKDRRHLKGTSVDLLTQLQAADAASLPKMRIECGEQDYFLRANRNFAETAARCGADAAFCTAPGNHDWKYWRERLQGCVRWAKSGK